MEVYYCLPTILLPLTFNLIRKNNALEIVIFCCIRQVSLKLLEI
jgi:hypothetical protein